jgi:eukaryotic-like serine/threonine-protein kinase
VRVVLADVAYIRGDWAAYDHQIEWGRGTPDEKFLLFWKAGGQAGMGKIKAARQTYQQARSELMSAGIKDFAGALFEMEAINDDLIGDPADARKKASQALELAKDSSVRGYAAEALALAGDVTKSASLLAELNREAPDNMFLRSVISPTTQAAVYLQKNQPEQAIATLEMVRPYELGVGPRAAGFMPNHLRGVAYLRMRDGAKAAVEFQRILDHQGVAASDTTYALARLNLGRAYVLQGDTTKARTAYQDFLARWKDADPDLPILNEAKAEYAKLQ